MNLTVIGASAGVGLACVQLALERGHCVTTLSRRVESFPINSNLRVIKGSSTEHRDVGEAVRNADAVLVTLGTGTSTKSTTLYSRSAHTLLKVLHEQRSAIPLVVLTGFGAGDSWDFNSFPMKVLFRLFLKEVYADKTAMELLISKQYSKWTIVRPGRLTSGKQTGKYRVLTDLAKGMGVGAISRADVAHFLVGEAELPLCTGKYPALTQ